MSVKYVQHRLCGPCRLMVVGEAPGAEEEEQGMAFVGKSGKFLTNVLKECGLNNGNHGFVLTNVVKVRPPKNRTPTQEEIDSWLPCLSEEYWEFQPKIIIALGTVAARALLNNNDLKISEVRGAPFKGSSIYGDDDPFYNSEIVCTYHPSYIFRKSSMTEVFKKDIKLAIDLLKE